MSSPKNSFPDVKTRMIAILGHPVHHSFSPVIHNTAFQHQGLNFVYLAVDLAPERLSQALHGLSALGFAGANVTIPHKQAVLPYMDCLSESAKMTGAVNTIVCKDDQLYGDNTDVEGFMAPLRDIKLQEMPMTLLGAGGAARAAAYALIKYYNPKPLTLVARRARQAEQLVNDFAQYSLQLDVSDFESASKCIQKSRMVVNSTPVGMHPQIHQTPWDRKSDFSSDQIVYDLIYRPARTQLLQDAESRGAMVIGGLTMLIEQAAAAYRQWTGREMPLTVVRSTMEDLFYSTDKK